MGHEAKTRSISQEPNHKIVKKSHRLPRLLLFRPRTNALETAEFVNDNLGEVKLKGPGRGGIRFNGDEWKTWLTVNYKDEFQASIDTVANLMAAVSKGARWRQNKFNPFVVPQICIGEHTGEILGQSYFFGAIVTPLSFLQSFPPGSENIPVNQTDETGRVIVKGNMIQSLTLTGVEETSHFYYYRKHKLESGLDPQKVPRDVYRAQDHEFIALQDRLRYIKQHPKDFDPEMLEIEQNNIERAGKIRELAKAKGYTSVDAYLKEIYS